MLRYTLLAGLFCFILASCNPDKCFQSTGPVDEIQFSIDVTETITIYDFIDLRLVQSDEMKAVIRGGSGLIGNISVEQSAETGEITIEDRNECRWMRDLSERFEVELHIPFFRKLNFKSHGNLYAHDWELPELELHSLRSGRDLHISGQIDNMHFVMEKGAPDLYLSGNANSIFIYHFGSGFVYARDMMAEKVHVNHRSTGHFHLFPIEELFAELYSSGNVYYYNQPDRIDGPVWGSGRVIQAD